MSKDSTPEELLPAIRKKPIVSVSAAALPKLLCYATLGMFKMSLIELYFFFKKQEKFNNWFYLIKKRKRKRRIPLTMLADQSKASRTLKRRIISNLVLWSNFFYRLVGKM